MELSQNVFLEELLLAPARSNSDWAAAAACFSHEGGGGGVNYEQQFLPHHHQWWNSFDPFEEDPSASSSLTARPPDQNPLTATGLVMVSEHSPADDYYSHYSFLDPPPPYTCTVPEVEGSTDPTPPPYPFGDPTGCTPPSLVEDHPDALLSSCSNNNNNNNNGIGCCKVEDMEQL
ncbi:hypothetical protein CRG98_037525, partial [Punica granatum]